MPAGIAVDEFERRVAGLEQTLHATYEHAPFGSHTLTADGRFCEVNAIELAWLGEDLAALAGKRRFVDCLTAESRVNYLRASLGAEHRGHFDNLALDLRHKDGSVRPVSLSSVAIKGASGEVLRHRATLFDMSLAKQHDLRTRIAARAFESLSGLFVCDRRGAFLQVNQAFATLTGHTKDGMQGHHARRLRPALIDMALFRTVKSAIEDHGRWEGQVAGRRKDGTVFVCWVSVSALADDRHQTERLVGSVIDITANKAAEAVVSRLAHFDTLTQLPNRLLLADRIDQALVASRRTGLGGAVMLIDLDSFKAINDAHGHEVGDALLIEMARRLEARVREGDSVARQSGDEFLVLLTGLSPQPDAAALEAKKMARALLDALSRSFRVAGHAHHCTASVGVDIFAAGATASSLVQHAHLAMHQAKKGGGNGISFFDQDMQVAVLKRVTLEGLLRDGLARQQLQLHYQPQVNRDGQVIGAEALLRWQHPERGIVSPPEFIRVAEETGLILPIGQWVMQTACAQLKAWTRHPQTRALQLAIKVSPHQFAQAGFVAQVEEAVRDGGISRSPRAQPSTCPTRAARCWHCGPWACTWAWMAPAPAIRRCPR
jgi:diguanylate cyclase (GGDEF)-like protein/PAS domain S-box-containing protein